MNNLRALSVLKVSRIVTMEKSRVVSTIGKLDILELHHFKTIFKSLVDFDEE